MASDVLSTPCPVRLTCSCSHARRQSVPLITAVCSHSSLQSGSSRWTVADHSMVEGETITDCCITLEMCTQNRMDIIIAILFRNDIQGMEIATCFHTCTAWHWSSPGTTHSIMSVHTGPNAHTRKFVTRHTRVKGNGSLSSRYGIRIIVYVTIFNLVEVFTYGYEYIINIE